MANLNLKDKSNRTFDAIVVGTGVSSGWAAKELCEGGLKTLVLDRGRNIKHVEEYETANHSKGYQCLDTMHLRR